MTHSLTRKEISALVTGALQWARETRASPDALPLVRQLALAVEVLEDGRRLAAQALDAARDHIETVSGHPDDPVEAEILQLCAYAAARMAGHLSTPLDPETLEGVERAEIYRRAVEIADDVLQRTEAECPPVDDTQILAAAVVMIGQRAAALVSQPRYSDCNWCGRKILRASDQWIRHALECPKSPGAFAYRRLSTLEASAMASCVGGLAAQADHLQEVRRLIADATALVAEAENTRLLRENLGQQHESDCPTPLEPHATCEEPAPQRCPRAKSSTTPCFLKDGDLAESDDDRCVGCNLKTSEIK